jgi:hypothetical protein
VGFTESFAFWYPCVDEKFRETAAARINEWFFGGNNYVFKFDYDLVWTSNGGTVGDGVYEASLNSMDSFIEERDLPVIGPTDVVTTPTARLQDAVPAWQAFNDGTLPCNVIRGK